MTTILAARWVLPIASSAISDGAVAIDGTQIIAVGCKREMLVRFPQVTVSDWGEAAILPGFVNTHSHLELTVMRGLLEDVEHDFFAWLRKLTVARMSMTTDDLRISATCGALEAARAGITCIGDASSLASESVQAVREVGLRGTVYQESFGPDPATAIENVAKLREQIAAAQRSESSRVRVGVSPHAPYTVSAPQLEMITRIARDEKLPVMMHAAESSAEKVFMQEGRGPFAEGLRARGIEWRAPGLSTIQYLERHGVLQTQPLLAHCVTVDGADLQLVGNYGAAIAHCPKSNAKLRHGRAPFSKFLLQGIKTGLGSDSVASNNTCDILEEARFAALVARADWDHHSAASAASQTTHQQPLPESRLTKHVSAEDVLFAATLGGACALGLDGQTGSLAPGMQADIAIVGLSGTHQQPMHNPADALIFSSSGRDVLLTMVAGKEIYREGRMTVVDEEELRQRLRLVRSKLDAATVS
jgi:cytosine/adenosine deaminase-related metal-dependent hydrolase